MVMSMVPLDFSRAVSAKISKIFWLKLVLLMFPGQEKCVVYFADTKKQLSTRCVIHPALIAEMQEWLGAENVVVK